MPRLDPAAERIPFFSMTINLKTHDWFLDQPEELNFLRFDLCCPRAINRRIGMRRTQIIRRRGFTWVEAIVVMAVIAVVVALCLPAV
jgi:prepilin-type N-terminal cleavage/methylation domain-containing protein